MRRVAKEERRFGVTAGSVLAVACTAALWRGHSSAGLVSGSMSVMLLFLAWLSPSRLARPRLLSDRLSVAIASLVARVALTVVFVAAIVPIGLVRRTMSRDALAPRRGSGQGWMQRSPRYRSRKHYLRMF